MAIRFYTFTSLIRDLRLLFLVLWVKLNVLACFLLASTYRKYEKKVCVCLGYCCSTLSRLLRRFHSWRQTFLDSQLFLEAYLVALDLLESFHFLAYCIWCCCCCHQGRSYYDWHCCCESHEREYCFCIHVLLLRLPIYKIHNNNWGW